MLLTQIKLVELHYLILCHIVLCHFLILYCNSIVIFASFGLLYLFFNDYNFIKVFIQLSDNLEIIMISSRINMHKINKLKKNALNITPLSQPVNIQYSDINAHLSDNTLHYGIEFLLKLLFIYSFILLFSCVV